MTHHHQADARRCYHCAGSGAVAGIATFDDDAHALEEPCPACDGEGIVSAAEWQEHVDAMRRDDEWRGNGSHKCAIGLAAHHGPCIHRGHPTYDAWLARQEREAEAQGIPF